MLRSRAIRELDACGRSGDLCGEGSRTTGAGRKVCPLARSTTNSDRLALRSDAPMCSALSVSADGEGGIQPCQETPPEYHPGCGT